jgi:hypothetical protein
LRREDDVRVEDFIKNVRYARSQCYHKPLLVKLILDKKIIQSEKRGTCLVKMENYEDTYAAVRKSFQYQT